MSNIVLNCYYYWPRLSLAFKVIDRQCIVFVERHFLKNHGYLKRLCWRFMLNMAYLFPTLLSPRFLNTVSKSDLIYLGASRVEFSFDDKIVKKTYRNPIPKHVHNSMAALPSEALMESHEQHADQLVIKSVLYPGEVLARGLVRRKNWPMITVAIDHLKSLRGTQAITKTSSEYVRELKRALPENYITELVEMMIKELAHRKEHIIVTVTHGDLKSENIIYNRENVNIIDWELAGFRNIYHDVLNLLLHELIHTNKDSAAETLMSESIISQLCDWCEQRSGECFTRGNLPYYLTLTMLEKYVLYVSSGRWHDCIAQCVEDWQKVCFRLKQRGLMIVND